MEITFQHFQRLDIFTSEFGYLLSDAVWFAANTNKTCETQHNSWIPRYRAGYRLYGATHLRGLPVCHVDRDASWYGDAGSKPSNTEYCHSSAAVHLTGGATWSPHPCSQTFLSTQERYVPSVHSEAAIHWWPTFLMPWNRFSMKHGRQMLSVSSMPMYLSMTVAGNFNFSQL